MNIYETKCLKEYRDVEKSQRDFMNSVDFPKEQVFDDSIPTWLIVAALVIVFFVVIGAVSFGRWMGGAW